MGRLSLFKGKIILFLLGLGVAVGAAALEGRKPLRLLDTPLFQAAQLATIRVITG
jgi:hypothetical protein